MDRERERKRCVLHAIFILSSRLKFQRRGGSRAAVVSPTEFKRGDGGEKKKSKREEKRKGEKQ